MNEDVNTKIKNLLKKNEVCLFMKGTPEVPQCGFSLAVSNVLKHLDVNFQGINVLENPEIPLDANVSRGPGDIVFTLIPSSPYS